LPSLPLPILQDRLRNEVKQARTRTRHVILLDDPEVTRFPLIVSVTLRNAPGPVRKNGRVVENDTHRLVLQITQDYPFQKPIVQWMSEIFHPNIMNYSEGGFVCTKFLEEWSFTSTLSDFLRGIEVLLQKPNPHSSYASCICREAAVYFLSREEQAKKPGPGGS